VSDRCKSCGAPIEWATSAKTGKAIPLDAEPAADGNLVVIDGIAGPAIATEPAEIRRKSHFATCPQAASWRNRK
jgi:hypothetical protein